MLSLHADCILFPLYFLVDWWELQIWWEHESCMQLCFKKKNNSLMKLHKLLWVFSIKFMSKWNFLPNQRNVKFWWNWEIKRLGGITHGIILHDTNNTQTYAEKINLLCSASRFAALLDINYNEVYFLVIQINDILFQHWQQWSNINWKISFI